MSRRHAIANVLLPFAAGYYLSCLFRTINALSSAALGADLHFGAAELGSLTSAYFFTFAIMQLPIGTALDRFGPRRVQLVLMPIAAAGAALFAVAESFPLLLLGRGLIGLGSAAALMAGLKALVLWLPKERIALANGCYIMLGALGAVTATAPAEALLDRLGWRGLFAALAAATLAATAVLWLMAPRDPRAPEVVGGAVRPRLRDVYLDRRFWHVAPLSACCIGTAFALQGLWAGSWLADVAMFDRPAVVQGLFAMALGLRVARRRRRPPAPPWRAPSEHARRGGCHLSADAIGPGAADADLAGISLDLHWHHGQRHCAQLRRTCRELPQGTGRPGEQRP
jgi:MFS family permease